MLLMSLESTLSPSVLRFDRSDGESFNRASHRRSNHHRAEWLTGSMPHRPQINGQQLLPRSLRQTKRPHQQFRNIKEPVSPIHTVHAPSRATTRSPLVDKHRHKREGRHPPHFLPPQTDYAPRPKSEPPSHHAAHQTDLLNTKPLEAPSRPHDTPHANSPTP